LIGGLIHVYIYLQGKGGKDTDDGGACWWWIPPCVDILLYI